MDFLNHLKDISDSPLAFIGYCFVAFLWAYRYFLINRPKSKLSDIVKSFDSDNEKNKAIESLLGTKPPRGLVGDQILEWYQINNKQKSKSLLLLGYIATLLTIIVIIGLTFYKTNKDKHKPPILIEQRVNK